MQGDEMLEKVAREIREAPLHEYVRRHVVDADLPLEPRDYRAANAAIDAIPGLRDVVEGRAMIQPGWQPIETAPRDRTILGWGQNVGRNICSWNGRQWSKTEMSAAFQLGPKAITHWMPLPAPPASPYAPAKENGDG